MNVRVPILLLLAATVLLGTARDSRSSCGHTTLERDIGNAEVIFAGTVRDVRVMPTTTHYVFENVRYAKGTASRDSVVLSEMGGSQMFTSVHVSFQRGARYVVLASKGFGGQLGAIACGAGHPFVVWTHAATGAPVMADSRGHVLLKFDSLHVVALYPKPWTTDKGIRGRWLGPPKPPLLRPLADVVNDLDSLGAFVGEPRPYTPSRSRVPGEGVRYAYLYPHQDTGDRVTEEEMLRVLVAIDQRLSRSPPTTR